MRKKITVLLIIMITCLSYGQNKDNIKYIRYNANTPEGKANLEAMNVAFKKMRELGCDKGLSWYYQAAIHNIPNEIEGENKLCADYQTAKDKLWAWGDCTQKKESTSSDLNFLLWHRMYIWYLEQIVRDLSGKKDFALPYWNYGSTETSDNIMPEKIRDKSGALYIESRYSILNNGKPILSDQVESIRFAINELRTNPSFSGSAGFSKNLEKGPHGYMHDLIGAEYANPGETFYNEIYQKENFSGLMANVSSAGFDPVFWLHHSMIDRIWESWDVSAYGQRPTREDLKANPWPYEFITPGGGHVSYTMNEVYDIVFNLDYKYDNLLFESKTPVLAAKTAKPKKVIAFQDSNEKNIWEQKIGKTLNSTAFTHKVTNQPAKNINKVLKAEADFKIVLNLDVVVYKEPKDYYTVYLRYPGKKDQYVGIMTFFGVAHNHGLEGNNDISENGVKQSFAYYISDDLSDSASDFEIVIKKTGTGDAKVIIENINVAKIN